MNQTILTLKKILKNKTRLVKNGKFYISHKEVKINEKGIFLEIENRSIDVISINSDDDGIYCFFGEGDDEGPNLWECSYCYTLNNMSRKKCGTLR